MPYYSLFSNNCITCKTESKLYTDHLPKTEGTYSYRCNSCNTEIYIANAKIGIEADSLPKNSIIIKLAN